MNVLLSYKPTRPTRIGWRAALVALLIIGTAGCAWLFGGGAFRAAEILYWQRRCLVHAGNPLQVVCEERVDQPASIEAGMVVDRSNSHGTRLAVPPLQCFARLASACGWTRLGGAPVASVEAPVLFCHRLATSKDSERLVVVTRRVMRFERWEEVDLGQNFGVDIFVPATFTTEPVAHCEVGGTHDARGGPILGYARRVRFFEGIPDPKDSSRFTFGYEMDGVPGVIEGQLECAASGDNVALRVLSGPGLDGAR